MSRNTGVEEKIFIFNEFSSKIVSKFFFDYQNFDFVLGWMWDGFCGTSGGALSYTTTASRTMSRSFLEIDSYFKLLQLKWVFDQRNRSHVMLPSLRFFLSIARR